MTIVPVPLVLSLATSYGLVMVTPGPNAIIVMRCSLGGSATRPIAAALGIATGAFLAACIAAYSAAMLPDIRILRDISALVFAALLLRTAFRLSRRPPGQGGADAPPVAPALRGSYLTGLSAALFNPVSVPFFIAFFVSHAASRPVAVLSCVIVFVMAALWFSALGVALFRLRAIRSHGRWEPMMQQGLTLALIGLALRTVWLTFAA